MTPWIVSEVSLATDQQSADMTAMTNSSDFFFVRWFFFANVTYQVRVTCYWDIVYQKLVSEKTLNIKKSIF